MTPRQIISLSTVAEGTHRAEAGCGKGIEMRLGKRPPPGNPHLQVALDAIADGDAAPFGVGLAKPAGRKAPQGLDLGKLEKVVARVQDAVAEPGAWGGILEEISAAAGAQCASLFRTSPGISGVSLVATSTSAEQLAERYVRDGWFHRDLRVRAIPKMLKTGVGVDQDFITPHTIEREPYYQEFLAPFGLRWWAGVGFQSGDDLWCMAIQRTVGQGYFDPGEQTKLATLCQRLTEAATISRAVGRARIAGMTDALGLVGQPALVLDHFGRVLRENTAVTGLYDQWFRVVGAHIIVQDREAAAAFAGLADACRSYHPHAVSGKRILVRRGERRPIVVESHALSSGAIESFSGGRVLLLVTDLEAQTRPLASALGATFGLTTAEARLAAIIGGGGSLDAACEALHVTRETARNQLKTVFAKTNTHRQAELVLLLSRLSTAFPPRSS
ncbi:helix-turn-helix transcriptional regulator [Bosea sp. BIWAKO-01]|uniref:helix-turn-helix transcriptional regulator n=1 Tax=Bosea sp. BIWAKO-01 TaxID=506668 RepID=UPI00114CDC0E|nr:helix-turn-helix transcriptional regulator [Bosea sp. BIWAKO-01]